MRGRTYSHAGYAASADISIPAPARGRTPVQTVRPARWHFNSRPREGANNGICCIWSNGMAYFNSRPREGANTGCWLSMIPRMHFNSRPREGANGRPEQPSRSCNDFNSRPREGANTKINSGNAGGNKFQFPPPRGGELSPDFLRRGQNISIPAPARGRTAVTVDKI